MLYQNGVYALDYEEDAMSQFIETARLTPGPHLIWMVFREAR